MRGTVFQFESFGELQDHLEDASDDGELDLPRCQGLRDGEWLLVTFKVGGETTSIAGCVSVVEGETQVCFARRDWEHLLDFAEGHGPVSWVPESRQTDPETLQPPPNTQVLIVDDDLDVQVVVTELLAQSGFAVTCVGSGEEAFDLLRLAGSDLVILDWNLPGMTGIEFCKRLRRDRKIGAVPVLFLTAHASARDINEAFSAGADDFVSKPFRARELGARVHGLLQRGPAPARASGV